MGYYERHLPHWLPEAASMFVTWRLYGSLPKDVVVHQEKVSSGRAFLAFDRLLDRAVCGPTWLKDPRLARVIVDVLRFGETNLHLYELLAFVVLSNHVHALTACGRTTERAKSAACLRARFRRISSLLNRDHEGAARTEFCHRLLIRPNAELPKVTRAIKGYSAREANRILHRTGRPFWQDESYDRWVRDQAAFNRIIRYIEHNPVSAGLVKNIEKYPWSSAFQAA